MGRSKRRRHRDKSPSSSAQPPIMQRRDIVDVPMSWELERDLSFVAESRSDKQPKAESVDVSDTEVAPPEPTSFSTTATVISGDKSKNKPRNEDGGNPVSLGSRLEALLLARSIDPPIASMSITELAEGLLTIDRNAASISTERQLITMRSALARQKAEMEIDRQRSTTKDIHRDRADLELAMGLAQLPRMIRWAARKPLQAHPVIGAHLRQSIDELRNKVTDAQRREERLAEQSHVRLTVLIDELETAEQQYEEELARRAHDMLTHSSMVHRYEEALHLRTDSICDLVDEGEVCPEVVSAAGTIPSLKADGPTRRKFAAEVERLEGFHERFTLHSRFRQEVIDLRDKRPEISPHHEMTESAYFFGRSMI